MEAFLDLIKDIWDFLKVRKKYWLAPLIVTIVLMGALIVFTQGSVLESQPIETMPGIHVQTVKGVTNR